MPSKPEIRRIVEGYEACGMTRREYCDKHSIPITTLDYWRRRHKQKPKLVEVSIEPGPAGPGFVLILGNGRRIESSWRFDESSLVRLIRAAEA